MNDQELRAENERLKAQNEELLKALADSRAIIRKAKDPRPVQRPSFKRVLELVKNACMDLYRVRGGWELKLGHLKRRFRCLREAWELLIPEEWSLADIFPPAPAKKTQRPPRLPFRQPSLAPRVRAASVLIAVPSG